METSYKVLMTLMGLEIGGAETHVLELCKALTKRGLKVYVASNGGAYEKELSQWGIKHFNVPLHNKKLHNVFSAYKALKTIIIENDIKLVHAHARIPAFLCGIIKRELNIRFVTTAHWIFTTIFPFKILTNWGERSLAVSDDIKQYLMDNYKVSENHIKVTINGIDTLKFSAETDYSDILDEFSLDKNATRIVYISRLDKDRSLVAHHLIEITEKLYETENNLEIVIVGGGNDFNEIKSKALQVNKQLNKKLIYLAGARTDVNKFVASAHIFIGVSRAALEAMAAAKPVLIGGNEGYIGIFNRENLDVGINTNFCCRGCGDASTEKLKEDISTLLKMNQDQRDELGNYGRELIKQNYSVEKMADDALELYEWVRYPEKEIDVMVSGYYGFNNNGDDAVLKSIVDDLKGANKNIKILVLSKQPKETEKQYNVVAINRFKFLQIYKYLNKTNLLISGGGSLIQDLTSTHSLLYYLWVINSAIKKNVKVMLYANGIGPVKSNNNKALIMKALNKVDLITLRDINSFEVLNSLGVTVPPVYITVDAAFSLKNTDINEAEKKLNKLNISENDKYFCVAIRSWKYSKEGFESEIAAFADYMWDNYNYRAIFIPMQPIVDTEISKRTISIMKSKGIFLGNNYTTNELLGIIERSQFILAMRLHTIIYAIKTKTPVIGLVYDPKVLSIMEITNQDIHVDVENISYTKLIEFGNYVIANRECISRKIAESSNSFKEKAAQNVEFAKLLLNKKEF